MQREEKEKKIGKRWNYKQVWPCNKKIKSKNYQKIYNWLKILFWYLRIRTFICPLEHFHSSSNLRLKTAKNLHKSPFFSLSLSLFHVNCALGIVKNDTKGNTERRERTMETYFRLLWTNFSTSSSSLTQHDNLAWKYFVPVAIFFASSICRNNIVSLFLPRWTLYSHRESEIRWNLLQNYTNHDFIFCVREMEGERYEENKEARHDSLDTHSSLLFSIFMYFYFCWRDFEGFFNNKKWIERKLRRSMSPKINWWDFFILLVKIKILKMWFT